MSFQIYISEYMQCLFTEKGESQAIQCLSKGFAKISSSSSSSIRSSCAIHSFLLIFKTSVFSMDVIISFQNKLCFLAGWKFIVKCEVFLCSNYYYCWVCERRIYRYKCVCMGWMMSFVVFVILFVEIYES